MEVVHTYKDSPFDAVQRSDGAWVPKRDPEYMAWLAEGNTPGPADPVVPAIPEVVTMRQARLALLRTGMLATVNNAIAGMAGTDGDAARIEWEYAQEVRRDSSLVQALASTLGMSESQLDSLFIQAATL